MFVVHDDDYDDDVDVDEESRAAIEEPAAAARKGRERKGRNAVEMSRASGAGDPVLTQRASKGENKRGIRAEEIARTARQYMETGSSSSIPSFSCFSNARVHQSVHAHRQRLIQAVHWTVFSSALRSFLLLGVAGVRPFHWSYSCHWIEDSPFLRNVMGGM